MPLAMEKWSIQFSERLKGTNFQFVNWIQNVPRGLVYFLPWLILIPFIRFSKFHDEAQRQFAQALAWGTVVPFLFVNLVPGAVARYSMPSLVPASWLLAMTYAGGALRWPGKLYVGNQVVWGKIVTAFVVLGLIIGGIGYPVAAFALHNKQQVTRVAETVNGIVPSNETLYVVNPHYQPLLFYLKAPLEYVHSITDLPAETHYFLVRAENKEKAATTQKWAPSRTRELVRVKDYSKREMILFEVGR